MGAQSPEPTTASLTAPPDDAFARSLRGLGPVGIAAILIIFATASFFMLGGTLLVLAWAQRSRTPWRDIGYVRPASWPRTIALGILFGTAFKLLMKSLVMPLLGAPPINAAFHDLAGNTAALPGMLFSVTVGAGFGEETIWRGFLFERLGRLFRGAWGKVLTVVLTAALFGAVHFPVQGLPGVQQALIVGLVYGTVYATRGQLPMLMIAHAAFDVTAVALIYWELETTVARWFFR